MRFRFGLALPFLFLAVPLTLPLSGCKPRNTLPKRQPGQPLDTQLTTKPDPQWVGKTGTLVGMTLANGQIQPVVGFTRTWEDLEDFTTASMAAEGDKVKAMAASGKFRTFPSGQVQAVFLESRETRGPEPIQAAQVKILSGHYKDQTAWIWAATFKP